MSLVGSVTSGIFSGYVPQVFRRRGRRTMEGVGLHRCLAFGFGKREGEGKNSGVARSFGTVLSEEFHTRVIRPPPPFPLDTTQTGWVCASRLFYDPKRGCRMIGIVGCLCESVSGSQKSRIIVVLLLHIQSNLDYRLEREWGKKSQLCSNSELFIVRSSCKI